MTQLSQKQSDVIEMVLAQEYTYYLYGGAIGGGKTYLIVLLALILCRIYPGSRWAICRETNKLIELNIMPTFFKLKPDTMRYNGQKNVATHSNGSEILFLYADLSLDPLVENWNGLEVNGIFYDEISEIAEAFFTKGIERKGRWRPRNPKVNPPQFLFGTCNPTNSWVKSKWYDPHSAGLLEKPYIYIPAYMSDNPYLNQDYLDSLKDLPPEIYEVRVNGNWNFADRPNQLINYKHILNMYNVTSDLPIDRMSIDVARFGDDSTVFKIGNKDRVFFTYSFKGLRTNEVAEKAIEFKNQFDIPSINIIIDTTGLGSGVLDHLHGLGIYAISFMGAESPMGISELGSLKFKNKRAESFYYLRHRLEIKSIGHEKDMILENELTNTYYSIHSDKTIMIESKEDIKKRLGRSPDNADSFSMYIYIEIVNSFQLIY